MIISKAYLLLFLMPLIGYSQVPHSISGTVNDMGGLPLPNVDVILEQLDSRLMLKTKTNKEGHYHFDCLVKGIYSITFKSSGFITERMENFTYRDPHILNINRELRIDPAVYDSGLLFDAPPRSTWGDS
jgi:hypothetical protein